MNDVQRVARALLNPRSVALVGASGDETKNTGRPVKYLQQHGYQGRVLPINATRKEVFGVPAYPTVRDAPGEIDIAFVMVPAKHVPDAVAQCCERKVPVVSIFSDGFGERSAEGRRIQDDMVAMARDEITQAETDLVTLESELQTALLPKDPDDVRNAFLEIRAGTGGDEAALFAGDLYEMYTKYAREKGWRVEEIAASPGEAGGFKEISFGVSGDDAYQFLRYESGGHRVQRVPATETQGRIHTSAATVAVLPEPEEAQVEINPQDLLIEVMRAGGAGGQHVNKTESAVRIWYKKGTPDEVEVKCQDGRSQTKNKEQAMRVLRGRVPLSALITVIESVSPSSAAPAIKVWVKVRRGWAEDSRVLRQLGYQ